MPCILNTYFSYFTNLILVLHDLTFRVGGLCERSSAEAIFVTQPNVQPRCNFWLFIPLWGHSKCEKICWLNFAQFILLKTICSKTYVITLHKPSRLLISFLLVFGICSNLWPSDLVVDYSAGDYKVWGCYFWRIPCRRWSGMVLGCSPNSPNPISFHPI